MGEIIKAGQRFRRRPVDDDQARVELADERFKVELIGLKGGRGGGEVEGDAGEPVRSVAAG